MYHHLAGETLYTLVVLGRYPALSATIRVIDLLFMLTAIAFNLLIAGIFIASKYNKAKLRQILGITWMLLAIPLFVVFVSYVLEGMKIDILVSFCLVFLYMLAELLLDYVFHVEFREKPITHIPYIVLEYAALFSLIHIASAINATWGWIVGVAFWMLIGCLIFLYWEQITRKKKA